jgi:stage II sporulation protein B
MKQINRRERGVCILDKPKKSKTITIKINGNEQSFQENSSNTARSSNQSFHETITSPSKKASPSENSVQEIAAAQEADEDSFEWILPENDDEEIEEYRIVNHSKKAPKNSLMNFKQNLKRNNSGPLKSFLFAIFFAILLGTSLGLIMLKLVFTDQTLPADGVQETETTEKTTSGKETPAAAGDSSMALVPISTFIIQGNVYSSKEGAKVDAEAAIKKGVPAQVLEVDGKALMVLGVSDSLENAKQLGQSFKAKGLDFFAKPFSVNEKPLTNLTSYEKNLLEKAPLFYQTLTSAVGSSFTTKSIPDDVGSKLTELETEFAKAEKGKGENAKIKEMGAELVSASQKVQAYAKSKKEADYLKSQQHLLTFLTLYHSL